MSKDGQYDERAYMQSLMYMQGPYAPPPMGGYPPLQGQTHGPHHQMPPMHGPHPAHHPHFRHHVPEHWAMFQQYAMQNFFRNYYSQQQQ
jgi:hypothetical protein